MIPHAHTWGWAEIVEGPNTCRVDMLGTRFEVCLICLRWRHSNAMELGEHLTPVIPLEVCPTEGCDGDPHYAAPGRGHRKGCDYPRTS